MIDELIRKYGRYMGGIDYEKVLNQLMTEEETLREIERRLAGIDTGQQIQKERDVRLQIRQLLTKYVELKNQESQVLELIKELKLTNHTRPEVIKAIKRLRRIRRQIRLIKQQLKALTSNIQ
ncbi:MAG: hypothetical protein TU36_005070 [Vulcanisaeta sp. AZ3]|jgi:hypothetical protein|nr:MAG: hypothetical protein TU36_02265 [Vulcanisaeta sp. AZ3]